MNGSCLVDKLGCVYRYSHTSSLSQRGALGKECYYQRSLIIQPLENNWSSSSGFEARKEDRRNERWWLKKRAKNFYSVLMVEFKLVLHKGVWWETDFPVNIMRHQLNILNLHHKIKHWVILVFVKHQENCKDMLSSLRFSNGTYKTLTGNNSRLSKNFIKTFKIYY